MKQNRIYYISFFEGAAVMATELCGTKLISPYFGSSLYVWASVIAVTLGSLAAGYFLGGRLSLRQNRTNLLTGILIIAAVYMSLMPVISGAFQYLATISSLVIGSALSSFILLFIPMLLMGAASPMIISILPNENSESGKVSGMVYSISTLGGIIATFLSGFYFIPEFGIKITLLVFSLLLLLSLVLLSGKNRFNVFLGLIVVIVSSFKNAPPAKNCIYEKDGLLGKLNILDDSSGGKVIRKLLINSIVQTEMDLSTGSSVSDYITLLDSNVKNGNGKALVLGLGGGLTSNLFVRKGYSVYGVELDERIIETAKNYFFLDKNVQTSCNDARNFINTDSKTYNLILADLFRAEEQPAHVITIESMEKLKKMLSQGGQLIINWHGYTTGIRGLGTSILLNTLSQSGFKYKFAAISNDEDARNLLIFASLNTIDALYSEIQPKIEKSKDVNTDMHPLLEKYNAEANYSWRKNYIRYYYSGS